MKHKWLLMLLAGIAAIAGAMMAALFLPIAEHWRAQSPDGAFIAIAHTQPIYAVMGMMPGHGGDKPGRVTVYRGSQSCGAAWVPMVWMANDLRWEVDTRPRRAEIKLIATWNLDDCSIERVNSG